MAGIVSYGAWVPRYRLGKETAGWNLPVEKAVANFDEDSITMSVAAGLDCISGFDRSAVDALYFATTTSPYIEKQGAAIAAAAIDLRTDILTNDFTNSLRAGTLAIRAALDAVAAGSARQVMVTAADGRMGAPRGDFDQSSGDGAAALLLGRENVIAEVIGGYSLTDETLDIWRAGGDSFIRSWEDRFIAEAGYLKVMPEAIEGLLRKYGVAVKDISREAFYGPNQRRHAEMARRLGFTPAQVQDALFGKVGNTGAAHALMLLTTALESARPGDKILVASYGDGADAYLLEVTNNISKLAPRRGVGRYLPSKKILASYDTYLTWRGLLSGESGSRRPPVPAPSAVSRWRERDGIDRLHGSKCTSCGLVQYPPQRVCTRCHGRDQWQQVRLAETGKLFTFSLDYIAGTVDVPMAVTIIDFEGGGRGLFEMTDRELDEVRCDAPVEMSFRKLRSSGGVHNYFWKAIPPRV